MQQTPAIPNTLQDWSEYNPTSLVPKYIANRYDDKSNRFYYFRDENNQLRSAAGITTWLSQVMPESPFLTDWKLKYGKDWRIVLNLTSEYGTALHSCVGHMMKGELIPNELKEVARDKIIELQQYDKTIPTNMVEKNIISFKRFMEDYKMKPLLIEAVLICRAKTGDYYAMTQDILAEIEVETKEKTEVQEGVYVRGKNKGKPKMVSKTTKTKKTEVVCIDIKSNFQNKDKKSFFESHLYQLIGTKKAVLQNFGIKVDRVFNWSPLSWRSSVGDYEFHEWNITERHEKKFELYEQIAAMDGLFTPSGKIETFKDFAPNITAAEMYAAKDYLTHIEEMEATIDIQPNP